jgi:RNA polymerase primary sigma factor
LIYSYVTRLSKEREQELATLIQAGRMSDDLAVIELGKEAEKEYVTANLRLVLSIARKVQNTPLEFDDLVQEGTLGLMHAVRKFDWTRGIQFSTYATIWIRKYISRAQAGQGRTIRIPEYVDDQLRKVKRTQDRLTFELGYPATDSDVAAELGIKSDDVSRLLSYNQALGLLETPEGAPREDLASPEPDDTWQQVAAYMTEHLTDSEIENLMTGNFESAEDALAQLRREFDSSN